MPLSFISIYFSKQCFLRLPLPGGGFLFLYDFVGAAHGRRPTYAVTLISTKPLFQFIWCSTYWIQVLIPRLHQFFSKFGKIFGSWWPSFNLFSSSKDLVTLITLKPLIRYTRYSKYCIEVIIPSLRQFFRKFGRISGSWRPSLTFFCQ